MSRVRCLGFLEKRKGNQIEQEIGRLRETEIGQRAERGMRKIVGERREVGKKENEEHIRNEK